MQASGAAQVRDYLDTGGPFPARLHLIALMSGFFADFADLVSDWTRMASGRCGPRRARPMWA